jgi:hypothetical protein
VAADGEVDVIQALSGGESLLQKWGLAPGFELAVPILATRAKQLLGSFRKGES